MTGLGILFGAITIFALIIGIVVILQDRREKRLRAKKP